MAHAKDKKQFTEAWNDHINQLNRLTYSFPAKEYPYIKDTLEYNIKSLKTLIEDIANHAFPKE